MIYNGAMLSVLLTPPLSSRRLVERVVSFEPAMFGEPDWLVVSRLRQLLVHKDSYAFYRWDMQGKKLRALDLQPALAGYHQMFDASELNRQLAERARSHLPLVAVSPELKWPALAVDHVDVVLTVQLVKERKDPPVMILGWLAPGQSAPVGQQRMVLRIVADGQAHLYRFEVSEHKSWVAAGNLKQVALEFPFAGSGGEGAIVKIGRLALNSAENEIPDLQPQGAMWQQGNDGIWNTGGAMLPLAFDASRIPGATQVCIELSPVNSWFEHYTGTFRDHSLSANATHRFTVAATRGTFTLNRSVLTAPGYYEVRAAALSAGGKMLGYVSDPVSFQ